MNAAEAVSSDDFGTDLRQALAVWSRQPLLPLISILFWLLQVGVSGSDALSFALAIVAILFLGWPGTEREWYRRAFAGEIFPASEIWPTTRRFFSRFLRLSLIFAPFAVAYGALSVFVAVSAFAQLAFTLAIVFIIYVLFTFVTPALTFTTPSVIRAISIGITMLRSNWAAAAPYALTPALVVTVGTQALIEPVAGPWAALVATTIAGAFLLALKGATVAFYLRHSPTPSA